MERPGSFLRKNNQTARPTSCPVASNYKRVDYKKAGRRPKRCPTAQATQEGSRRAVQRNSAQGPFAGRSAGAVCGINAQLAVPDTGQRRPASTSIAGGKRPDGAKLRPKWLTLPPFVCQPKG